MKQTTRTIIKIPKNTKTQTVKKNTTTNNKKTI